MRRYWCIIIIYYFYLICQSFLPERKPARVYIRYVRPIHKNVIEIKFLSIEVL